MTIRTGPNTGLLTSAAPGEGHYLELTRLHRWIDFWLNPRVTSRVIATPPGSPLDGDAYIIGSSPTGAWAGKANQIARWTTEIVTPGWEYMIPKKGWSSVYSLADSSNYQFDGSAWGAVAGGGGGGGSAVWGAVGGTLTDQADLVAALAGKADDADIAALDTRIDALEAGGHSYSQTFGDGSAANFIITHNLGTKNVHVTVYRTATPWDTIVCDVSRLTTNTVELYGFGGAPTAGQYTVVVSK